MFKKILIANRGEIAVRIVRACRDMGIISTVVCSEADRDSLHAHIADETICIGPAKASDSYLSVRNVIAAAVSSGADAIHPGYGFLAENQIFAESCARHGLTFIGPSVEALRLFGDKAQAKALARHAGVPLIPGSEGVLTDIEQALEVAAGIGYPVMLKAVMGGGGKGIRLILSEDALKSSFGPARSEALASFGNGALYLEKFIASPRHIEIQILADQYGKCVYLGERECSIQRRHQKIVEESPSAFVDEELRRRMGETAVALAHASGYRNAGTVEFLVDKNKNFFFMEMNPRIQVEHPVTEMVTGVDLVVEQIKIASGEHLSFEQKDIGIHGHAIECRITAEDPSRGFAPCPGLIEGLNVPGGPGVRVDTAVYQGYRVPPYYDSLLAKLIVHGDDRDLAIRRMRRAVAEFLFDGITTNSDFHLKLLAEPDFVSGDFNVDYLETHKF